MFMRLLSPMFPRRTSAPARFCRVCGCTDETEHFDARGKPCWWVEPTLCSACRPAAYAESTPVVPPRSPNFTPGSCPRCRTPVWVATGCTHGDPTVLDPPQHHKGSPHAFQFVHSCGRL